MNDIVKNELDNFSKENILDVINYCNDLVDCMEIDENKNIIDT